jgi:16S rRNA (guanine527-N7)-methyltransferase
MDVGSGGGSPAIPMKLAVPGLDLIMVEAKTRKSAFLREAIRHLELFPARVENARYEELLARPELHEALDALTVRAVRVEVRVLMGLQAFLKPGGDLLLFRGPAGPDFPATLTPPLFWQATHPLVDSLKSRLVIVRKAAVGAPAR